MAWEFKYESALPPLPRGLDLSRRKESRIAALRQLPAGCWSVLLTPRFADDVARSFRFQTVYEGTFRLEKSYDLTLFRGSADLYLGRTNHPGRGRRRKGFLIPIFPLDRYRYYLRLVGISSRSTAEDGRNITVVFETYRLQPDRTWQNDGKLKARVGLKGKGREPRLEGIVLNEAGSEVFDIRLAPLAQHIREAIVTIDRVAFPGVDLPDLKLANRVFEGLGWSVRFVQGDTDVEEPNGAAWSPEALHSQILTKSADLGTTWTYNVLLVRMLTIGFFKRYGLMYDAQAIDSNHVPREGVAVAFMARLPLDEPFGSAKSQVIALVEKAYAWAFLHELGHAMGLAHRLTGTGIMQGIQRIAHALHADPKRSFPEDIRLSFDEDDEITLKHAPDPWVRPGGLPFLSRFSFEPIPVEDLTDQDPELKLVVEAHSSRLPFGAPLRLNLTLENLSGSEEKPVPADLSMGSGYVSGALLTPSGALRRFSSIARYVGEGTRLLKPERQRINSATLLRGPEGALLESPGLYRVDVEVAWETGQAGRTAVSGSAFFLVDPHEHPGATDAAFDILTNPDAVLPLIFRNSLAKPRHSHIRELASSAHAVVARALDDPLLRPHYAVLEAKRIGGDPARREEAAELIDASTVMTGAEAYSIAEILGPALRASKPSRAVRQAALICLAALNSQVVDPELRKQAEALLLR